MGRLGKLREKVQQGLDKARDVAEELGWSGGGAGSGRLRDLVRAVRACKTAAEERDVVARESANLREAFKDQGSRHRHINVAKLMYIHMLGYPTHFGQMETLKLIAANTFAEKRVGYLGLMILLDERHEVLMLVTNSVKQDINNTKNQYVAGLALAALGNVASAAMAHDLAPDVERRLEDPNPYVRKKAALCAIRVLTKNPELVDEFIDKAGDMLHDKSHAVLLAGVTLMLAICGMAPAAVDKYRAYVPLLCKVLHGLLQGGFNTEYDAGGITDPFLQVKILQLLRVLGRGDPDASDRMTDVLAQVAANVEGGRNAGNAVLYEAVNTIFGVETMGGLRVMAVNILGRFLGNRDNNIRYVALNTLAKVVSADRSAVQRHRATIAACVKDPDASIRRRALELVCGLVNESNARPLTAELLDYLAICDADFRPDLAARLVGLVRRYAPDKRWHLDHAVAIMSQPGSRLDAHAVGALAALAANAPELQAYAARAAARALRHAAAGGAVEGALLTWALWTVGEFGEALAPSGGCGSGGLVEEGEDPLDLTEEGVVGLVEAALLRPRAEDGAAAAREVSLTALAKLSARLPGQAARIAALLSRHSSSQQLELQARSCEFGRVLSHHTALQRDLLERMPAPDEGGEEGTGGEAAGGSGSAREGPPPGAAAAEAAVAGVPAGDELLDLLGGAEAAAAAAAAGGLAAVASGGGAAAALGGLEDLLGGSSGDGGGSAAAAPAAAAAAPAAPPQLERASSSGERWPIPPVVAYDRGGVRVVLSFEKPSPGLSPGLTTVHAEYSNEGETAVEDFALQAAVPKYMQLRMEPASSSLLPARGAGVAVQSLFLLNSLHGQKGVAMRLRVAYRRGEEQVAEQVEVAGLPTGL